MHESGKQLCPPRKEQMENRFGPTYAPDTSEVFRVSVPVTQEQRKAYESGNARIYLWGKVASKHLWSESIILVRERVDVESLFCRSFGIEEERLSAKFPKGENSMLMVPCNSSEWPYDDLTPKDEDRYADCQKQQNKTLPCHGSP